MDLLSSIVLGIIEGLTEFLPISSTAHLKIATGLLGLDQNDPFIKTFQIAIQLGAILAVVVLYGKVLLKNFQVNTRVLLAFLPTAIIAASMYKFIRETLLGDNPWIELSALAAGGLFIILFERFHHDREEHGKEIADLSILSCLGIGLCQAVSVIPGISRAAATIIGGLAVGMNRKSAVEFSFFLAVPTMAAATVFDLYENAAAFTPHQMQMLGIGFVVSFVVAIIAIRFLLQFVRTYSFVPFGYYRIVLAAAVALLLFAR